MDGDLLSVVLCATQHERRASSYYFPSATWQPAPSTSFFDRVPPHVEPPPSSSPCLMQQQQYCPVEAGLPSLVKQEYLLPFATNYNISANLKRKGDQLAKTKPVSKRRKSEQKRIVHVQSDEQAPPDEWAWRKYGQKPIKGSPHPRSYYKCSSCKGCPARKQVERCPTDPGLLILAYTFHHNHPAPKRVTNSHFISHQHCDRTTTTTCTTTTADSCASPSTAALKEEPTSTETTVTETTQANLVELAQTEKSPSVALISSAGILNDFGEDVFGFLEDLDVDLVGATWEDYNEDEYENEELKRIIRGPCSSASFLDNLFPWSSTWPPLAPSSSSSN